MAEVNRAPRIRTMLGGRIEYDNGRMAIDCVIRNLSSGGAKVTVDASIPLPPEFDLSIPQKGRQERARLVWRNREEIGVAFAEATQTPAPTVGPGSQAERIQTLEQENAKLRKTVNLLKARLDSYMESAI